MKIVYFIPSLYNSGGMERVLTTKVNYFVENFGYEISIVVTNNFGKKPFFELDERVEIVDLNIDFYEGNNPLFKILKYRCSQKRFKNMVQQWLDMRKVDFCISYFGREIDFFHELTGDFTKIGELHFSRHYRRQIYSGINQNLIYNLLGKIRDFQLLKNTKKLDKLVVLTEEDKQSWVSDGIENVVTIANPCPIELKNRMDKNSKMVLSIGRFVEQKGFDSLLRIWAKVSSEFSDWSLHIYGEGPLKDALLQQIDSLNIKNINLHSFATDIESIYSRATIFSLSSKFEGLPMVLIEAQSSGIPSVAYDCPCGPSEIIIDGKSGFVIPLNDESLFAKKLSQMMASTELQETMSSQSLQHAYRYTLDNIAKCWNKLFLELVR